MKGKKKCLYTNMLKRLNMLDEQCSEMQASLAMVREWVATKMDPEPDDDVENESIRKNTEEDTGT